MGHGDARFRATPGATSAGHETSAPASGDSTTHGQNPDAPRLPGQWFATTHWSVVLASQQKDSPQAAAALETLCRTYWFPLCAYIRRRGHPPQDAQDLTQEYFARLLERDYLASATPTKGKLRSFLLTDLNYFLSHHRERERAVKRGGGNPPIPLDEVAAEKLSALEPTQASPESAFEKDWAFALLEKAFASVRQEFHAVGKMTIFERLKPFLGDGSPLGDHAAIATDLGMSPNAVAVAVHRLRQRYREAVRMEIAHTVASTDEIEGEMRHLFAASTR
jgi:RNA polymerase sigma factor (sigma-70 family)